MKNPKFRIDIKHLERRSGFNRRWIKSDYSGQERRTVKDRRDGRPFQDLLLPEDLDTKKIVGFENRIPLRPIKGGGNEKKGYALRYFIAFVTLIFFSTVGSFIAAVNYNIGWKCIKIWNSFFLNMFGIEIICENIPEVIAIYVFGSFAQFYETKESDLDIAIFCEKKIDKVFLWKLAQKIASQVPEFKYRYYVDSGPALEKAIAVKAGIGWQGKNSIVITSQKR